MNWCRNGLPGPRLRLRPYRNKKRESSSKKWWLKIPKLELSNLCVIDYICKLIEIILAGVFYIHSLFCRTSLCIDCWLSFSTNLLSEKKGNGKQATNSELDLDRITCNKRPDQRRSILFFFFFGGELPHFSLPNLIGEISLWKNLCFLFMRISNEIYPRGQIQMI